MDCSGREAAGLINCKNPLLLSEGMVANQLCGLRQVNQPL